METLGALPKCRWRSTAYENNKPSSSVDMTASLDSDVRNLRLKNRELSAHPDPRQIPTIADPDE